MLGRREPHGAGHTTRGRRPGAAGHGGAMRSQGGLRVLVVEDDPDAAEGLARFLRAEGHQASVAPSGGAALRALREGTPDVALIDVVLPDIDGYELARRLRRRAGGRPLLVSLTGFWEERPGAAAGEAGVDAHLLKPVGPEELRGLLLRL